MVVGFAPVVRVVWSQSSFPLPLPPRLHQRPNAENQEARSSRDLTYAEKVDLFRSVA